MIGLAALSWIGAILIWAMVIATYFNCRRQHRQIDRLNEQAEAAVREAEQLLRLIQWMASAVRAKEDA